MTGEELRKANERLKKVDIGKDKNGNPKGYVMVTSRIAAFRDLFPMGEISTEIISHENGVVLMKTSIRDEVGNLLGTGFAQEKESSSFINKTSYIENCETSAVGRALAMVGIGSDTSMCSAEELANAMLNQNKEQKNEEKKAQENEKINQSEVKSIIALAERKGYKVEALLKHYKIKVMEDMTAEQYLNCISNLNNQPDKKRE